MLNMFKNRNILNLSVRLESEVSSFVQNAVRPIFSGLLVYRNYGLFGSVGIVDTVVHSSLRMASLRKNSERSIQGKNVKK